LGAVEEIHASRQRAVAAMSPWSYGKGDQAYIACPHDPLNEEIFPVTWHGPRIGV
jgi:hypothetical protein